MNTTILLHSNYCNISNNLIEDIKKINKKNDEVIHICIDNSIIRKKILDSELKIEKVPSILIIENDKIKVIENIFKIKEILNVNSRPIKQIEENINKDILINNIQIEKNKDNNNFNLRTSIDNIEINNNQLNKKSSLKNIGIDNKELDENKSFRNITLDNNYNIDNEKISLEKSFRNIEEQKKNNLSFEPMQFIQKSSAISDQTRKNSIGKNKKSISRDNKKIL